jgi:ferrous iron transport protein A
MKLSQLKPGQQALIRGFYQLSDDVRKRLMVMGILPETSVLLVRRAPMGDPLQIEVRGVSLAIRERMAAAIEVEVVE